MSRAVPRRVVHRDPPPGNDPAFDPVPDPSPDPWGLREPGLPAPLAAALSGGVIAGLALAALFV